MGNILAKIGHFFEIHVEKIVLVVFGILSLYVLVVRVLFSPNVVEFDGQSFSPSKIDQYIGQKYAGPVREAITGPALSVDSYEPRLTGPIDPNDPVNDAVLVDLKGDFSKGFLGRYASAIDHIDDTLYPPQPRHSAADSTEKRKYKLPFIGEVRGVRAGYIRAAAYYPAEEITEETVYDDIDHEPNDLDLVTVEANFDVGLLRQRFIESFDSEDLPVEWRDDSMAEPVCAAVNLQRQELLADGRWGPWQDIRRLPIDHDPELMRPVTRVEDLPSGGIRVRMLQLNKYDVRQDLLQPLPYEIATTYEEWFPPSLHEEFLKLRDKERKEEKRAEREADSDQDTSGRRPRGGQRNSTAGRGAGTVDAYGGGAGGAGGQTGRTRGGARGARNTRGGGAEMPGATGGRTRGSRGRGRTGGAGGAVDPMYGGGMEGYGAMGRDGMGMQNLGVSQMSSKFREVSLTFDKVFSKLDVILFWAHDDTVESEKTYRYRIRLGVLNPAAGINDDSGPHNNDVVLWTEFSGTTDVIKIPHRGYFFAKDYKEVSGAVSVEVLKFDMGYWRSENFQVKPGETVGKVTEVKQEEDRETFVDPSMAMYGMPLDAQQRQEPETVDFRTGVVFVDAVPVDGWTGGKRLRAQSHYTMLYSLDQSQIMKMPVGRPNWPEPLVLAYNKAKQFQKEPVEDFRDFGSSLVRSTRSGAGGRGGAEMGLYGDMPMMNPGR
jgi:hypothetical protein